MWELISANKRNSIILLILMAALLLGLGFFFGRAYAGPQGAYIGILIAGVLWFFMMLTSYFQGDQILLGTSNAQKVTKEVHPQLFNVVEEMTIASGLPKMPDIYIINDPGMNAFATGRNPQNASVAVTAGLLARLNRDELQGVMAHEISHIVHRDILFVTMAGIMLGAIVMLSQIFLRSSLYGGRSRYSSRDRDNQGQAILIVIAIVCAILAPIFAQLLYFALSRKREYLADAGAARLTRYPDGLASALEKIAQGGPNVASANKVTAPMYIVNPLIEKINFSAWTSTHPPIGDRIRILRNLTGGASLADYERNYSQVTHNHNLIPAAALKEETPVELRSANMAAVDSGSTRPQARQVGDIMHRVNAMKIVECPCGLKMKVPPAYKNASVQCPRCGSQTQLPRPSRE